MSAHPSSERQPPAYSEAHRALLLGVARDALTAAAASRPFEDPRPTDYPEPLRERRACFVTLEQQGELRGCIGTLHARLPLVVEVAHMARAAACDDPRFSPVRAVELGTMELTLSVLSAPEPLRFHSEQEALQQIRPGIDGLILRDGSRSGTFLPSVWEKLPHPQQFLQQLKRKAGLPLDHWSDSVKLERYTSESFSAGWWS